MGLRWKPEREQVRIQYSDAPERGDLVRENGGKIFAVVGPFDDFTDKPDLQRALQLLLRGWNLQEGQPEKAE